MFFRVRIFLIVAFVRCHFEQRAQSQSFARLLMATRLKGIDLTQPILNSICSMNSNCSIFDGGNFVRLKKLFCAITPKILRIKICCFSTCHNKAIFGSKRWSVLRSDSAFHKGMTIQFLCIFNGASCIPSIAIGPTLWHPLSQQMRGRSNGSSPCNKSHVQSTFWLLLQRAWFHF